MIDYEEPIDARRVIDATARVVAAAREETAAERALEAAPADAPGNVERWQALQLASIERAESVAALDAEIASDPLHPLGKCACASEGACAWCLRTAALNNEAPR